MANQPRLDFEKWQALYRANIDDASWVVPGPIESPMDIVKRELAIRRNTMPVDGVPVDYFLFGLGYSPHPACTKFGGVPYRSKRLPWPMTKEGGPCEFMAQINFSSSRDLSPNIPSDLLLIFLTWEDGASTEDYYFEWAQTSISDPITVDDVPEPPFGIIENPVFCELLRSVEFRSAGHAKDEQTHDYDSLAVSKIGGVSDYFGGKRPALPGLHLFTISSIWTSKGRPFPFLNHYKSIPKPNELGGSGGYMFKILMLGDIGEAYFFLDGDKIHVASRCL